MHARSPFLPALLVAWLLTGCPDAQRGEAPLEASPDGSTTASPETPADAEKDGGPTEPRVLDKIADVSGNLVVAGDRVFVVAKPGIVSFATSGGPTIPVMTGDVHYPLAADQDRLFYVAGTMSLETVGHAGDGLRPLAGDAAGFTVTLDDRRAYWVAQSSQVKSIAKDGTTPAVLRASDSASQPTFLAVTDTALVLVVWEPFGKAFRIVRRPKDANTTDTSLATASRVLALRTHGKDAYWIEADSAIRAAAVEGGGHPLAIAGEPELFDTSALAVDATHVYWASRHHGRVYRAARATGIPEMIAEGLVFPDEATAYIGYSLDRGVGRIAVDGTSLYVSDARGVFKTRK